MSNEILNEILEAENQVRASCDDVVESSLIGLDKIYKGLDMLRLSPIATADQAHTLGNVLQNMIGVQERLKGMEGFKSE